MDPNRNDVPDINPANGFLLSLVIDPPAADASWLLGAK